MAELNLDIPLAKAAWEPKIWTARWRGLMAQSVEHSSTPLSMIFCRLRGSNRVNDDQGMVDAQKLSSRRDRLDYVLGLIKWDSERFNALAAEGRGGTGRGNTYAWIKGKGGFPLEIIQRLKEECEATGVQGFTLEWLNHNIGDWPIKVAPEVLEADHRLGDLANQIRKLKPSSRAAKDSTLVRFPTLDGYAPPDTPFVDIPSFLLPEDSRLSSPYVRCLFNPSDSMRGEIEKGDLVFVDSADTDLTDLTEDGVYAFKLGVSIKVKKIQIWGIGELHIQGTHPSEDAQDLKGAELQKLKIGGRVIGSIGSKKF